MTTNQKQKLLGQLLHLEETFIATIGAMRLVLDGVDTGGNVTPQENVDYTIENLQAALSRVMPADTVKRASDLPSDSKLPTTPSLPKASRELLSEAEPTAPTDGVDTEPVEDFKSGPQPLTRKGTADLMKWLENWKAAIEELPASDLQRWDAHKGLLGSVRKYMTDEQLAGTFRHLTDAAYVSGIAYNAERKVFEYVPIPEAA